MRAIGTNQAGGRRVGVRASATFVLLAGCLAALDVLFPTPVDFPDSGIWRWVLADPERVLLTVVRTAGWLLAAWLFMVTALTAMGTGAGAGSRFARRLARILTPLAMRHLLEASLGVALAIGPAGAALAESPGMPAPSTQPSIRLAPLPPVPAPIVAPPEPTATPAVALPNLDRPGASAPPAASAPPPPTAPITPAPAPAPKATTAPRRTSAPAPPQSHTVESGDTLWGIAADRLPPDASPAEITLTWQQWYAQNRAAIGPDPAFLLPGQLLSAPQAGS